MLQEEVGDGRNRVLQGDALDNAAALLEEGYGGKVRVAYIDPPYLSATDYAYEARLDGTKDGRVRRTHAFGDQWGEDGGAPRYLDMLAPRLHALSRLLSDRGTLWVHLDWRASYLARVLLDEIFGRDAFLNEIVWRRAPNLGRQAQSSQFGRTIDTILVYGKKDATLVPPTRLEPIEKEAIRRDEDGRPFTAAPRGDYTDQSIERLDAEGRVHRSKQGKVYIKYFLVKNERDEWCRERRVDSLWTDVAPIRHARLEERTGYPTQKPLALLERIISCASDPGDLVVDLFGGSGTTAEAAHRLGRKYIVGDAQSLAIATIRARLMRAGSHFVRQSTIAGSVVEAPLEATVERHGDETFEVRISSPVEPLAWWIEIEEGADGPLFSATPRWKTIWHSERGLGGKPAPIRDVARFSSRGPRLRVSAHDDEGKLYRMNWEIKR